MRVLVTGAGGQVGHEVSRTFTSAGWEVIAAVRADLDAGDRDAVLQACTGLRPDAIVHTAAFTKVDDCESQPDRAWRDNALACRFVAEGARRVGAHLLVFSTDYVFDGTKPDPYVEWDATNPLSVYGRSKLGGEIEAGPDATVVRTSWVVGAHGPNIVKTILRIAADPDATLTFVDDQRGCPTFAADLAGAALRLVSQRLHGTFHVTNQGAVSWYELACKVLVAAGLDPTRVRPVSTEDLQPPRPAPRPLNSVLDNAALRLMGLPLLPELDDALPALIKEIS